VERLTHLETYRCHDGARGFDPMGRTRLAKPLRNRGALSPPALLIHRLATIRWKHEYFTRLARQCPAHAAHSHSNGVADFAGNRVGIAGIDQQRPVPLPFSEFSGTS